MGWIIGGLIAALVGTAMQSYGQAEANRKAQAKMKAAQYALGSAQDKINAQIQEAAAGYESPRRIANQEAEANRIASDIKADVSESQAIRDTQQETAGNVSEDYKAARTASQDLTKQKFNAFADLIGQIRSAGTLRQNEGFRLNRYAQNVDQLAKNARGDFAVGQAQAQDALHSKDGLINLGKVVQAIGAVASMYGGIAAAGASAAANTATATGTGLTAGGTGVGGLNMANAGQALLDGSSAAANSAWASGGLKMANAGQALLGGSSAAANPWTSGIPYMLGGGYLATTPLGD